MFLSFVSMREPFPVINDAPFPEKGSDMEMLAGNCRFDNYNAHFIPVASIAPRDPFNMVYFPCWQDRSPEYDEILVFDEGQALPRFLVVLAPESSSPEFSEKNFLAAAERGDLHLIQKWIAEDRSRFETRDSQTEEHLLYLALIGNHLDLLGWALQEYPCLMEKTRKDGRSLCFLAILGGRKEALAVITDNNLLGGYSSSLFASEAACHGIGKESINSLLKKVGWKSVGFEGWVFIDTKNFLANRDGSLNSFLVPSSFYEIKRF